MRLRFDSSLLDMDIGGLLFLSVALMVTSGAKEVYSFLKVEALVPVKCSIRAICTSSLVILEMKCLL